VIFKILKKIKEIEVKVKKSFLKVREELDHHLEAINENTADIQKNYEMILYLQERIDELTRKIDEIYMAIQPQQENDNNIGLNKAEKELFLELYYSKNALNVDMLSKKLLWSKEQVQEVMYSLIEKKIPILRKIHDDDIYYYLDNNFKRLYKYNKIKIREE